MLNNFGLRDTLPKNRLPFIATQYMGHTLTIRRTPDYAQTINRIKAAFQSLHSITSERIMICANFPGIDASVQITEDLWSELSPTLVEVKILVHQSQSTQPASMTILCVTPAGIVLTLQVELWDTIEDIKAKIEDQTGIPAGRQDIQYRGEILADRRTLSGYGITRGSTLQIITSLRIGKPVIYIFPPVSTPDVHVRLSLTNAWEFSALYPPTPIMSGPYPGLNTLWEVRVLNLSANGTLHF
ncbi:Ubiquitin [Ceratobasidium sp. UAMH 11750]|nr:Ubiquitin [Ceratobasidium sp. UAMH 11750]